MKKLAYPWWCYGAALAIVWLIAVLPISSWALKNHIDILGGGWGDQPCSVEHRIMPTRLVGADYRPGDDRMPIPAWVKGAKYPRRFDYASVRDYAHVHPDDPSALATLIRFQFRASITANPSDLPNPVWQGASINQARAEGLWAAGQGAQLDPDNAFFWISRAVLLNKLGKHEACLEALAKASQAHTYRDFVFEEEETRYQELVNRVGYRGEKAHDAMLGEVLLPHLATYRHLAKDIRRMPDDALGVQAKVDMLRFASTMLRQDTSLIGMLVADALVEIILEPQVDPKKPQAEDGKPPNLAPLASTFYQMELAQNIARPFDPRTLVRSVEKVRGSIDFDADSHDPLDELLTNRATGLAPSLLVGLLLSILIAAITCKLPASWSLAGRRLMPFVGALSAYWIATKVCQGKPMWSPSAPEFYWGIPQPSSLDAAALPLFSGVILLGLLQFIPMARKSAMILGVIGAFVWILYVYPDVSYCAPALAFFACLAVSRIRRPVPPVVIGVGLFAVCWSIGCLAVYLALPPSLDSFTTGAFLGVLAVSSIIVSAGSKKVLQVAPVVSLLLACGYLFTVTAEMRDNQTIKAALDGYQHEAEVTRAKAGIS